MAAPHARARPRRRDGFFQPAVHPREGFRPGASIEESPWTLEQIEQELRAQLELALRHLPQATYTWPHMLFTSVDPSVGDVTSRLTAEYGLITPFDLGIQWVGRVYQGSDIGEVKAANLAARLETSSRVVAAGRPRGHRRSGDPGFRSSRLRGRGGRPLGECGGVEKPAGT